MIGELELAGGDGRAAREEPIGEPTVDRILAVDELELELFGAIHGARGGLGLSRRWAGEEREAEEEWEEMEFHKRFK